MNKEFGTPEYMLRRNKDPETSHEAAERVDTSKMEALIFENIKRFSQEKGCTSYDIFRVTRIPHYRVSPRVKGLEQHGYIYYRGDTRKGATNRPMRVIRVERRAKQRVPQLQNQEGLF